MTDTLLFVEDDDAIRDMAADFLGEAGLDVIEVGDADAALAVLDKEAHRIRVLFTDVRMPGSLDGLALAQMAAVHWPWINVIVTSGTCLPVSDAVPCVATFLPKPWLPLDMLTTVLRAAQR